MSNIPGISTPNIAIEYGASLSEQNHLAILHYGHGQRQSGLRDVGSAEEPDEDGSGSRTPAWQQEVGKRKLE